MFQGLRDSRKEAKASGGELHPPEFPWVFNDYGKIYDAMALRRGWHVYKNVCCIRNARETFIILFIKVCKTCHSMEYMSFREMTNHSHTVDEVKAIAAEFETIDEDTDEFGEEITRKCKHFDRVPKYFTIIAVIVSYLFSVLIRTLMPLVLLMAVLFLQIYHSFAMLVMEEKTTFMR